MTKRVLEMSAFARLRWRLSRRAAGLPRRYSELNRSLSLLGDLRSIGWQDSVRLNAAVDAARRPLPWYTYPAIFWLAQKVKPMDDVFEFGAGHSTLWFAEHVRLVVAMEDDEEWVGWLTPQLPENAKVVHKTGEDYVRALSAPDLPAQAFDLVVIDGTQRSECARQVADYVKPDGLVVFDNADRPENRPGLEHLKACGFRRVDFVGPIPAYGNLSCTSVLFRDGERWLAGDDFPDYWGY